MPWQTRPTLQTLAGEDDLDLAQLPRERKSSAWNTAQNFSASARGLYRVFNAAVYRFYWSDTAPPIAGSTPQASDASLNYTTTATFGNGTWYFSVSNFDGVLDSGFLGIGPNGQSYLTLTIAGGVALATPPSPPSNIQLTAQSGGIVQVGANYFTIPDDADAANTWAIYYTIDGTAPASGPGASPTASQAMSGGPAQILAFDLPAQTAGTTVKVQLQVARASGASQVYSGASEVLTLVVSSAGPTAPAGGVNWPGELPASI